MSFYHDLNRDKSYHRAIFLFLSLATAGLCSVYPVACFKKVSGKEKAKVKREKADLERQKQEEAEAEAEWERNHRPRNAHRRSRSEAPRSARRPDHRPQRRSFARPQQGLDRYNNTRHAHFDLGGLDDIELSHREPLHSPPPAARRYSHAYGREQIWEQPERLHGHTHTRRASRLDGNPSTPSPGTEIKAFASPISQESPRAGERDHLTVPKEETETGTTADEPLYEDSSAPTSPLSTRSSLPYLLRDESQDTRLYHKSSKPSQHLQKSPPRPPPPVTRSPSFYKPRVVEDSADKQPVDDAARLSGLTSNRPGVMRASSSQGSNVRLSARSLQIDLTKRSRAASPSRSPSRESAYDRRKMNKLVLRLEMPLSPGPALTPGLRTVRLHTPPEAETAKSGLLSPGASELWFPMIRSSDSGQSPPPPIVASSKSSSPFVALLPSPVRPPNQKIPSDSAVPGKLGRTSAFGMLARSEGSDSVLQAHVPQMHTGPSRGDSARRPSMDIIGKRRKSSLLPQAVALPPYFTRPSRRQASSDSQDMTPSSIAYTMETIKDNEESAFTRPSPLNSRSERASSHNILPRRLLMRSRTSDISNNASSEPAPRLPPTAGTDPVRIDRHSAPSSGTIVEPSSLLDVHDQFKFTKPSLIRSRTTATTARKDHLPGMRMYTPSAQVLRRPTGILSFFSDSNVLARINSTGEDSPTPATLRRRFGLANMPSLSKLFQAGKLSSQKSFPETKLRLQDDSLRVYNFVQTPYSQRYNDARLAEKERIRAYLKDDKSMDNGDDSSTFELDVPDHLPNSPLCPLSLKHKSGGKAICPLHRRKRPVLPPRKRSGRKEPVIVYESCDAVSRPGMPMTSR